MPPIDRRPSRKSEVLWGIVAVVVTLVGVIIFRWRLMGDRRFVGRDIVRKKASAAAIVETSAPSPLDALELVKVFCVPSYISSRPVFTGYRLPRDAKQSSEITVHFLKATKAGRISTSSLRIGADIQGTPFKVDSFEHKETTGPDGATKDVSEVTVINKETGEKMVWPLEKWPDHSSATFHYKWVQPGGQPAPDFTTQIDRTFTLPPKRDTTYKVIAITDREVVIEVPDMTRKTLMVPK